MIRRSAIAAAILAASPLWAFEQDLPAGARLQAERISPLDSYSVPVGVFADGTVPRYEVEGRVVRRSWRIDGSSTTTLQLLAPLRDYLVEQGYRIDFQCADIDCGGFDFRFGIEVIPAPNMAVDIRDYRFLSASRGDTDVATILASRIGNFGYVQVVTVGAPEAEPTLDAREPDQKRPQARPEVSEPEPQAEDQLVQDLLEHGHVTLEGLDFETGETTLGSGPYPALKVLGELMAERPTYRMALVGHTDTVGSLTDNVSLSRRRAEAVREWLITTYGIDPQRFEAEGVGYLAPRDSNLRPEGRRRNRRVEAVLLAE
ncbi:MAG: OmpA family protein [Rhodobacteraceae bacterium]|nr:OmpA family protein [Paracoccaceae bacterium]